MQQRAAILLRRCMALVCCLVLACTLLLTRSKPVYASGGLTNRSDTISDSLAGAVTTHRFNLDITNNVSALGSIEFEFCSNDPLPATACTAPVGFSASAAVLATQSGNTGFSIHGSSTVNKLILTRFAILPTTTASMYQFNSITNPTNPGSYYVRLRTFTSTDATGAEIEDGGLVFVVAGALSVTAEVPPYLKFCAGVTITAFDCSTATSFFIDMGEFSTNVTSKASSEFVVATNAGSGYSITLNGTTLTSGNNTIPPLTTLAGSVSGTSQFGINLRGNSNPGIGADVVGAGVGTVTGNYATPNNYYFNNGDIVVTSPGSSDNQRFTISYVANIGTNQAPGYYATTISLICLANF